MRPKKYNITKKFLQKEYIGNLKSTIEIAKIFNCNSQLISNRLHQFGIKTRGNSEGKQLKLEKILTRELLYNEYVINKLSTIKIAKKYKVSHQVINVYLKKFEIRIRTHSEASKIGNIIFHASEKNIVTQFQKGHKTWNKGLKGYHAGEKHSNYGRKLLYMTGDKNHGWKNGITPLNLAIRNFPEYAIWRKKVFERDNYICQICGKRGHKINADHKIPFTVILEKFLAKYNYETNQYKLSKLALEFNLFWNIDNGRTLCKDCHKETDTFAGRATNFLTK